jgi:glycosyltransferase involved in cell wall biosynthesis
MNRLHHLKQTLPTNIEDNQDYDNLEIIVLDYNSTDGLEQFIKENFERDLDTGKLIYYKTLTPIYFNRSHSRNLAFKLATGDVICNIDADNYTGKNFAQYVSDEFCSHEKIFLTTINTLNRNYSKDILGKICVERSDFFTVRGYDERMVNYGFEDFDFANRLELLQLKKKGVKNDPEYFKSIKHEELESISNEFFIKNLKMILINYITPASTDFIFLLNNHEYKRGTLIDNKGFKYSGNLSALKKAQLKHEYSILTDCWTTGKWHENITNILLEDDRYKVKLSKTEHYYLLSDNMDEFYPVEDPSLIQTAIMTFSQIINRVIMDENKLKKRISANENGFGSGTVYKNFDYKNPIII